MAKSRDRLVGLGALSHLENIACTYFHFNFASHKMVCRQSGRCRLYCGRAEIIPRKEEEEKRRTLIPSVSSLENRASKSVADYVFAMC